MQLNCLHCVSLKAKNKTFIQSEVLTGLGHEYVILSMEQPKKLKLEFQFALKITPEG